MKNRCKGSPEQSSPPLPLRADQVGRIVKIQSVLWTCAWFFLLANVSQAAAAESMETHASGVFLNSNGDVLTARHAVSNCHALYVVKDAKVVLASLRAVSTNEDVAVLRTTLKPYLSAVFQHSDLPVNRSVPVLAEAYWRLASMPDRASTLSNAITVPESEGELQLLSGVKPGASGSAVLGVSGLVLGVVVERVAGAPSATSMGQSRYPMHASGASLVRAVPAASIKRFLRSHEIDFAESDAAQISEQQSSAARAFTLGVGVICG